MTDNKIKNYCDMLIRNSCKILVDKPSRITSSTATLIDHIIINNLNVETKSGISICDISDHLCVFSVIPILRKRQKPNDKFIRDLL